MSYHRRSFKIELFKELTLSEFKRRLEKMVAEGAVPGTSRFISEDSFAERDGRNPVGVAVFYNLSV